ncbi:MAG: translation initiation factor IF-3 [Microthrixaceae bacterium]
MNDRIRAREVRVIDPDGEQLGIRPLPEALGLARNLDLDLVEVADKANPPVVRIMDYRKFKYEEQQRAKESRKKSTNIVVKEMKYRPKIGVGDFSTKTRKVTEFLEEGHKVKVTIMFRGREMQHPEQGMKILNRIAEQVKNLARVENPPRQDGRNMTMVLGPDKKAQAAYAAELKKAEAEAAAAAAAQAEVAAPATTASEGDAGTDGAEAPAEAAQPTPDPSEASAEATQAEEPVVSATTEA